VVVSVGLAVYIFFGQSAPAVFGDFDVEFQLVKPGMWWLSFIGYLLTPVVVIACYGWDAIGQRNALRLNRNFVPKPAWTRVLLWTAGVSIVAGAWHVLNLSVGIIDALAAPR